MMVSVGIANGVSNIMQCLYVRVFAPTSNVTQKTTQGRLNIGTLKVYIHRGIVPADKCCLKKTLPSPATVKISHKRPKQSLLSVCACCCLRLHCCSLLWWWEKSRVERIGCSMRIRPTLFFLMLVYRPLNPPQNKMNGMENLMGPP